MTSMTPHFRPSRQRQSRVLAIAAVAMLLIAGSLANLGARAEGGGEGEGGVAGIRQSPVGLITPKTEFLSGFAMAAATGRDPRLAGRYPAELQIPQIANPALGPSRGSAQSGTGTFQQVPFRNPAPAFSRNLLVSRSVGNYPVSTEPHIAVDPTDPEHLVAGVIDFNMLAAVVYVSFDGGESWTGPLQPRFFREDYFAAGDPNIAFDRDGNVYMSQLSIGFQEFEIGNIRSYSYISSIVVSKSTDGGLTWGDGIPAARSVISTQSNPDDQGKERGIINTSFLDKEWMTVGPSHDDPDQDVIYLSYTNFTDRYTLIYADEVAFLQGVASDSAIETVSSRDGGVSWSAPVAASPTFQYSSGANPEGEEEERGAPVGEPVNGEAVVPSAQEEEDTSSTSTEAERFVQGSQPRVLPDGTLVVAYFDCLADGASTGLQAVQVVISKDGGQTFSDPITAAVTLEFDRPTRTVSLRISGSAFPQLSSGPNGEIYIAFAGASSDKPTDDGDIFFVSSDDEGATWTQPLRVNQDDTDHLQFLPSIATKPDGTIGIMWGDTRDDPQEIRYNVYFTQSNDGGKTWGFSIPEQNFTAPDTRVTDFASSSLRVCGGCAPEIGDYWSMAASETDWYLTWIDNRLADFGGVDTRLAFARQTPIDPATLFLSPPSGTAGRTVQVQGFGFQPNAIAQVIVGGVLISTPLTDDKGQFQIQFSMPVTGEGPVSVVAVDESGNQAIASFYTEFGFDSLQNSLDAINQQLGLPNQGSTPEPTAEATPGP